ncbi:DUF2569 domain-containing protein [Sphingomonas lutea]|uniref:DUF2569 domain-containing protein n=1 Tax=Sphingomonas lutea TaxID=1045317 RepID=A0A7G9SJ97_9SPHN|nr:DUF2569 domain-containing protein [Sphingomonas lutea]QNN67922.1 DUF2569 domain-containing protein [Sphingomonas lutea]
MIDKFTTKMRARADAVLLTLNTRLDRILVGWLLIAGVASVTRIVFTPSNVPVAPLSNFASYSLLVIAPFATTMLALRWFAISPLMGQPVTRMGWLSNWRNLTRKEATKHRLYGTGGIMVSLLLGMMLNVPVRALEYIGAMPPLPLVAPHWLSVLHFAMTLDVVLFTSLYMLAFVAGLRRMAFFPRLLASIWIADLAMQLATAKLVMAAGPLPAGVSTALQSLLEGNMQKTLVSMALWLPYLLLSTRVNVTYRHRIPA